MGERFMFLVHRLFFVKIDCSSTSRSIYPSPKQGLKQTQAVQIFATPWPQTSHEMGLPVLVWMKWMNGSWCLPLLPGVATPCNTMQHDATQCNTKSYIFHVMLRISSYMWLGVLHRDALCCIVLQCVAECCSITWDMWLRVMYCVAECCRVL